MEKCDSERNPKGFFAIKKHEEHQFIMYEGDGMKGIEIDKCTENYTVRIPEILKHHLDSLPSKNKYALKEAILITMAKHIHEFKFDPCQYLNSK